MPADNNAYDAYALDPTRVKEPPTTFFGALRYLGPGFVLSASIVGSGELIATTTLGAKAGFVTLWVILVSCLVKVAIQLEFGRHTIQTGQTCLASFNTLPGPKLGKASWTVWLWLLMQPAKVLQVGGIVGGVALILNIAFPAVTVTQWCWITALVVALLVFWERYAFIEESLGTWANVLFLLGGFVVLFSTLFSALAAWTRIFADAFARVGLFDFHIPRQRRRVIAALAWIFPLLWCLVFLYYEKPVLMVIIGGVVTSLILLLVVFAALIFRFRSLPQLKPGFMYDAAFFFSAFCILVLAIYGTVRVVQENWPT